MAEDRAEWIKRLFAEAADLPSDRRADFLRDECGPDHAARFELESLLETEDGAPSSFMETPAFTGLEAEADQAVHAPPERIGRYRIVRPLGEGGMSIVYLAEQEQPRRQVAVKVIRPGAMSTSMYRRFQLEAEVLGTLKHEGIAQIFEADTETTPTGPLPFFAMEFVEGDTLDRYACDHQLDTRAKLELLARICDAVHHAHQKGVLHRDLKPANILVTTRRPRTEAEDVATGSDEAQPKILDFGVARAINSDLQLTTLATKPGQIIGTIPYMSPEQIHGDSGELDVRSDVYALGVIGYELLAGRLPYDLCNRSIAEAARIIRDSDPPSIATIVPQLRGDVSTILSKAMEKNKERRYQSAAELGADLRRYLEDEPILARPPTALYQLKKFAKRHKGLVSGAAVGTLALVLGLVIAVQQAVVATAARDRARLEEARSRRLAYRANITAASAALAAHDIALARRNLEETEPTLRQWEWHHLHSQLNLSLVDIDVPGAGSVGTPFFDDDGDELVVRAPADGLVYTWDARTGVRRTDLDRPAAGFARSRRGHAEVTVNGDHLIVRAANSGSTKSYALHDLGTMNFDKAGLVLTDERGRYVAAAGAHRVWRLDVSSGEVMSVEVDRRQTGVTRMALSSDGRIAIAAAIRGAPAIWNPDAGTLTPLLEASDFVRSISFSADDKQLVAGLQNATVMLWDAATRKPLSVGRGHRHAVTDVTFDPSGTRIASASLDRTIRLWDAKTLKMLDVLHGHDRAVWHVAFSPEGALLASTGEDHTVRVWDVRRKLPAGVLARHENIVFPVVFSPDGTMVASAGWDNTILLTDALSYETFAQLHVDADVVTALCFSPDQSRIVAATSDGYAAWDLHSGAALPSPVLMAAGPPNRLAARTIVFAADSVHVLLPKQVGNGGIYAWNTDTGQVEPQGNSPSTFGNTRLASPDGKYEVWHVARQGASADPRSARSDSGSSLEVIETSTGRRLDAPPMSGAFAFGRGPNGHAYLAGRLDEDRTIVCVWDLTTDRQAGLLQGHAENVYAIAFAPDGARIATAGRDSLRLWDTQTLDEVVQLQGHSSFVWSVAFSPDGSQLVSGSGDHTVRVWDTVTYRERYRLRRERRAKLARIMPDVPRALAESADPAAAIHRLAEAFSLSGAERRLAGQAALQYATQRH